MYMPLFGSRSRAALAAVAVTIAAAACAPHPSGDPKAGAALVQSSNCTGCHGGQFQGDLGPKLVGIEKRRSPEQIAKAISNPEPPMPKFALTSQQVADVVAYVSQLDDGAANGGGAMRPKILILPAKPIDSAMVSVWFPGTPPSDATVEARMSMGHSMMGTRPIKLKRTGDPHKLAAKVPFEMGGAWMIKVHYGKTHEIDIPIEVGQ
jgi:mono/diheme cytochrome c family protein